MTLQEMVSLFRSETEDLFAALVNKFYFNNGTPYTDTDTIYTEAGVPYATTQEVLDTIPLAMRYAYLTVNVMGVEYWFLPNGTLAEKVSSMVIADGSVALAKLASVATSTLYYRKSLGSGPPEVQTLATLAADLGIANKVDKVAGYSLILDSLVSKIHDKFDEDELGTIQGILSFMDGHVLTDNNYTDEEKTKISTLTKNVYSINLPSASTVAGRIAGAVAPTNFPTDWVLTADEGDLIITHSLNRKIAHVSVFSKSLLIERQLFGNAAYSGIYQNYLAVYNNVVIESLATIETDITIQLVFA